VRAVLPHTARQLVVANNGLIETKVGLAQTIETRFREVVIRLRGGNGFLDRDLHPTIQSPSQAH